MGRTVSKVQLENENEEIINPATEDKQDILIDLQKYHINDLGLEDGSDTYFGYEDKDGNWYFKKIDSSNSVTYATVNNNSSITSYSQAKTNYTSLTYNNYSDAF